MWVVVVAVIHGLFVTFAAHKFDSKIVTVLAAIISAIAGVVTGNPAYMGADLVGVVLGLWIGFGIIQKKPAIAPKSVAAPVHAAAATPVATPANEWVGWVIAAALIASFFYYNFLKGPKLSLQPTPQPTNPVNAPVPAPPARHHDPAKPKHSTNTVQQPKKPQKPQKSALQRCLEIPSDEKMAACLAGLDD